MAQATARRRVISGGCGAVVVIGKNRQNAVADELVHVAVMPVG